MTKRRIAMWAVVSAILLGAVVVGLTVYVSQMQFNTNAAVAKEKAQFDLTMTALPHPN